MATGMRDLVAKLRLDTTEFNAGVRSTSQTLKAVGAMMAAATAAFGAALSAAAIKGANDIDKVAKSARRVESSIGGFRALEMAAGEAGVGVETLADAVQTMDREIAKGSKGAVDSLRKIGLAASDLAGLDADQKLALIADGIKTMGLSSGEASAVLQGLGIRNKEMLLAVMQGGDAFRKARADVQDYGLALSSVQSDKIEAANDAIGRLSLIGQYFSQQLALKVVPALGAMAQAFTDSLREGGLLRSMIDAFVGSLDVVVASLGVATVGFGTYYVAALAAAKLATLTLAGALAFLRTALITTGIGVLVVAAGYLVAKFVELVAKVGGFGNAMALLKDVALEVWDRIRRGGSLMAEAIAGYALDISAGFASAFATVVESFASMTDAIARGWNGLMSMMGIESSAQGMGAELAAGMRAEADMLSANARAYGESISATRKEIMAPLDSIAALRAAVDGTTDSIETATGAAQGLGDTFEDVGGAGSKGGGKGGEALDKLKDKAEALKQTMDEVKTSMSSAFVGLVTGAKSLKTAVGELLTKFAEMLASRAFDMLWSGGAGKRGGIGGLFGRLLGFADGGVFTAGRVQAFAKGGVVAGATAFAMHSGLGVMGEAGPEAIMPLSRGADGKLGVQSSGGQVEIVVRSEPGVIVEIARNEAGAMIRQAAPGIVTASVQQTVALGREDRIF
ncbi:phage tail tape measure protein [Pseudotabrizicola algicola]|uniref:Phage tail tape measure protein n=1 Tax=Pseudotabrizicola algicola TaxID=2709381 RepID=A0A6B3RJ95_9RHOB|nr:phage tail tape measure protein [Pseudotabrizicola algicola]NEX45183.1 phage tail tape measure protein [Pseudotabrizicola algicola]